MAAGEGASGSPCRVCAVGTAALRGRAGRGEARAGATDAAAAGLLGLPSRERMRGCVVDPGPAPAPVLLGEGLRLLRACGPKGRGALRGLLNVDSGPCGGAGVEEEGGGVRGCACSCCFCAAAA